MIFLGYFEFTVIFVACNDGELIVCASIYFSLGPLKLSVVI